MLLAVIIAFVILNLIGVVWTAIIDKGGAWVRMFIVAVNIWAATFLVVLTVVVTHG